jgi:biopolymer transport protein ExbD
MEKRGFKTKKSGTTDVALQITSMADIFTIILVFLLKSFAGGDLKVSPSSNLKMPVAATDTPPPAALTLEISEKAVQVENAPIAELTSFRFHPQDLAPSGVPLALDSALDKQRKRQELIAKSNSDVNVDSKVLVVADERTPYVTLKRVLSTAALHGFTDFKLVVTKRE